MTIKLSSAQITDTIAKLIKQVAKQAQGGAEINDLIKKLLHTALEGKLTLTPQELIVAAGAINLWLKKPAHHGLDSEMLQAGITREDLSTLLEELDPSTVVETMVNASMSAIAD